MCEPNSMTNSFSGILIKTFKCQHLEKKEEVDQNVLDTLSVSGKYQSIS